MDIEFYTMEKLQNIHRFIPDTISPIGRFRIDYRMIGWHVCGAARKETKKAK